MIGPGKLGEGCPEQGATRQVMVVMVTLGSFHLSIYLFNRSTNQFNDI